MAIPKCDTLFSIFLHILVAPLLPPFPLESGKKFQPGARRTGFYNWVKFIRFAGMLALASYYDIGLLAAGL